MIGPIFVDTNVLVYRRDLAAGKKQELAERWFEALWRAGAGRISIQVLNEYYVVVTRKLCPGLPPPEAQEEIRDLLVWQPVPVSSEVVTRAWQVEGHYQLSYWDSLIVAAALAAGCSYLLTEDLQDGQDFDGVRVVDPFVHPPGSFGLVR